mgnify:CR=1 FL=1
MPGKNTIKSYVDNGYYHIYNRGINKQVVFFSVQDYIFFIYLLKIYLSSTNTVRDLLRSQDNPHPQLLENYYREMTVICFCLMPNHFHLLVRQHDKNTISHFVHALMTKYTMYINKKYDRTGSLFQRPYKALLITHDTYLLHLSRYIHLNPSDLQPADVITKPQWYSFIDYPFSSYRWYLSEISNEWFSSNNILEFFRQGKLLAPQAISTYQSFVEKYNKPFPKDLTHLTLE